LFAVIMLLSTMQSFKSSEEMLSAKISWMAMSYDFGEIPKSVAVSHPFEFTNTGEAPLVIKDVKTSCGCTVTAYPEEPIAPGASETIEVTYNAKRAGKFTKKVSVYTNVQEEVFALNISGEVVQ